MITQDFHICTPRKFKNKENANDVLNDVFQFQKLKHNYIELTLLVDEHR